MTLADAFFWILAVLGVASALAVIFLRDLFRAALVLVLSFLAVAGLFVLLNADFLAAVQVLIYAGAVSVLIVFAIMLTRDVQRGNPSNRLQVPALILATLLFLSIALVALNTNWNLITPQTLSTLEPVLTDTPQWLAGLLLKDFVLPFEIASVLLLAAIIGTIALVRER